MIESSQDRANRMLAEDQAQRLRARTVNHARPFCDAYCRCVNCKPALHAHPLINTVFAVIIGLSIVLAAVVVRVLS